VSAITERLALLDETVLLKGSHSPDSQFCVMELVAYIAGEPWSDRPECVSPVITSFLISWNDSLDDADRQMQKPLIPKVIGTRTSEADEQVRAWMCTDWLAREYAPAFLRLAGLTARGETLEALAPLTDAKSAKRAQPSLDRARKDSAAAGAAAGAAARAAAWAAARAAAWDAARAAAGAAARAAAWDAARAAARDAAWAAARDAAGAAARAAAWDAAGAAAWAAARAAARDAARDALRPTVEGLQRSALGLVERMCAVGRGEV
jgi:hypothetical protein